MAWRREYHRFDAFEHLTQKTLWLLALKYNPLPTKSVLEADGKHPHTGRILHRRQRPSIERGGPFWRGS